MFLKSKKHPLSISPIFNEKTLDYRFDNQAFVRLVPPQYIEHLELKFGCVGRLSIVHGL
jgi:hypothetical protein